MGVCKRCEKKGDSEEEARGTDAMKERSLDATGSGTPPPGVFAERVWMCLKGQEIGFCGVQKSAAFAALWTRRSDENVKRKGLANGGERERRRARGEGQFQNGKAGQVGNESSHKFIARISNYIKQNLGPGTYAKRCAD